MNIYHVEYSVTGHKGTAGVCAATKTEAASHAHTRLSSDGWSDIVTGPVTRICNHKAGDTWIPGNVLIYA